MRISDWSSDVCSSDLTASATATPVSFDRPSPETCAALHPARWAPETGHADANGRLRVVALQYKPEIRNVVSYDSFRTKMRCLVEDPVVPVMQAGRPTLAVFNDRVGIITITTGTRGDSHGRQTAGPTGAPIGDS